MLSTRRVVYLHTDLVEQLLALPGLPRLERLGQHWIHNDYACGIGQARSRLRVLAWAFLADKAEALESARRSSRAPVATPARAPSIAGRVRVSPTPAQRRTQHNSATPRGCTNKATQAVYVSRVEPSSSLPGRSKLQQASCCCWFFSVPLRARIHSLLLQLLPKPTWIGDPGKASLS